MKKLFSPFKLRGVEFKNRIFVSPMCEYSSIDGLANHWHLVHLGSRAVGGAALVMTEAAGVSPEGRISPDDLGIWSDAHGEVLRPIVKFIKSQNAVPGMQLAHAGRKASTDVPWRGGKPLTLNARGWQPIAPSALPFAPGYPTPREMTAADLDKVEMEFAEATRRALAAGFKVIEIHMAHGYLLHNFLSPLSNQRHDDFGGSLENRVRFPLRIARAVREVWPEDLPVAVRISASDWVEGGWDLTQSIQFSRWLKELGIDLIDCSSGGTVIDAKIPAGPGFQTPFATAIRQQVGIATGAVGFITDPFQAEQIVATGLADAVFLARQLLRDPYWPLHAAQALGVDVAWPAQYERAKPG
ncbi:MAG TPA: NADH:flavin oxidoreductase/NADH oxidase [Acidiferrobacterales bacterium]|nr:NADH:flavin oxidoreductase/NADH oxidase [Acidiferrobacterales bacterium]